MRDKVMSTLTNNLTKPLFINSDTKHAKRVLLLQLIPLGIGALIMLATAVFLIMHPAIHPDIMFDDTMSFVDFKTYTIPPYLSIFSYLGFMFWFFGSGFCMVGILIIRRIDQASSSRAVYFLAALAGMGLIMGLDDMLRLHENVIPYYFGIKEIVTLGFYGLYFVFLIVAFRKEIATHNMLFLVLFYVLFGFSEVVDILSPEAMQLQGSPLLAALEEMPKFLGLIAFASYCLYFTYYEITRHLELRLKT
jgi:hypothetical protein